MNPTLTIIWEQLHNLAMIFRIATYEEKANYQSHYLGILWQYLNPLIQIGIYFVIFNVAFKASTLQYILVGMVVWLFMSNVILQGANSILNKMQLASKMNFPLSILPNITIAANLPSFFVMLFIVMVALVLLGDSPSLFWLQLIYYLWATIVFLFAFSLFNATISVLVRDYQLILQSAMRILFYAGGVVWDLSDKLPGWAIGIAKLNPLMYLLNGFRDTLLYQRAFWIVDAYTCYFWFLTLFILYVGAALHLKFRDRLIDFI